LHASDLVSPYPTVRLDTPVITAARLLAGQNLPGLIVIDNHGSPATILPGTRVLRLAVPHCQEDPALARVIDEAAADVFCSNWVTVRSPRPYPQSTGSCRW
jgi:hypothetical protein